MQHTMTLYGPQYTGRARVSSKIYIWAGAWQGFGECVIYNDPKMAAGEGSTSSLELELKFGGTTHASDVHIRTQLDIHFVLCSSRTCVCGFGVLILRSLNILP